MKFTANLRIYHFFIYSLFSLLTLKNKGKTNKQKKNNTFLPYRCYVGVRRLALPVDWICLDTQKREIIKMITNPDYYLGQVDLFSENSISKTHHPLLISKLITFGSVLWEIRNENWRQDGVWYLCNETSLTFMSFQR